MPGNVIQNDLMSKNFPERELFANFKIFYDLEADEFIISQITSDLVGISGDQATYICKLQLCWFGFLLFWDFFILIVVCIFHSDLTSLIIKNKCLWFQCISSTHIGKNPLIQIQEPLVLFSIIVFLFLLQFIICFKSKWFYIWNAINTDLTHTCTLQRLGNFHFHLIFFFPLYNF